MEWGKKEQVDCAVQQRQCDNDKGAVGRRPTPMAMGYSLEAYRRAPPLLFKKGKDLLFKKGKDACRTLGL